ncbi:MAG: [FeFe] hydrogenase H-cluster radical SAM maturase HydG [Chitinispirillia bacterium]|nr:[FeFe] hydrogenase H-cluster radical SAM maturase HydG [Chitinispirillia bacterium]MCL2269377.1 [FeFe] hydrogenase H-cluster radical SAM maturase HydG [Chitinispirillia bacterium]
MLNDSSSWIGERIHPGQIEKYLDANGDDFIPDGVIAGQLASEECINAAGDKARVRDIIAKSLSIKTLAPDETATLLNVRDPEMWQEMEEAAGKVKKAVYDNRIVTFAPLYLSTACVNNCRYCGLRTDNQSVTHGVLSLDEVKSEIEVLAGKIGHKRLVVVYGEHPKSGIDYMVETIETIYKTRVPIPHRPGRDTAIRRVNVNAAPMTIEELTALGKAGLGTYQVFQETYHKETYKTLHPHTTLKGNYRWRLYCMHRALEAGIDDVGIGALFGLYDWRFDVMGLLYHSIELEKRFGIGPHTVSFPRLEPAENTPFISQSKYIVDDKDFRKALTVIRLSITHAGMILTARENAALRKSLIPLGITQTDASSNIGLGAYNKAKGREIQESTRQQFILGDTRSLDDVVREYAQMGYITSFCTAGYRCGRTGECIMDSLRTGAEGKFCKLNAVVTFREWLDDFATPETKAAGETVINKEIGELQEKVPKVFDTFMDYYNRTVNGERDLYF